MRGRVLAFDFRSGEGKISGDDGNRYDFAAGEWHGQGQPAAQQTVDFETSDSDARAVYPIAGGVAEPRSRVAAALLAFFLGSLGAHKFYIGKNGAGLVMLLISVTGFVLAGVPTMVMGLIALVECVIYLTMSQADFEAAYVRGPKAWF